MPAMPDYIHQLPLDAKIYPDLSDKPALSQPLATRSQSSVLESWAAKHKIEKYAKTSPLAYVVRAIVLVAAAILMCATLAAPIAIYNFYVMLREKHAISWKPDSVLPSIRSMKTKEETDKFQTMRGVVEDFQLHEKSPQEGAAELTQDIKTLLLSPASMEAIHQTRRSRYILRDLNRSGPLDPEWLEAMKDEKLQKIISFPANVQPTQLIDAINDFNKLIKDHHPHLVNDLTKIDWNKIQKTIQKNTVPVERVDEDVSKFQLSIDQLLKTLKETDVSSDPAKANQELIGQLRKALRSPVYQALKEDPSQPSIHFLHRLASDIWNKAPSLDAYQSVGASIAREIEQQDTPGMCGKDLAEQLEASHEKMEKIHWSAHGISGVCYAVTHPRQLLGGLASEGGAAREIPAAVGLDEYDSHGTLSNNPSLQGVTSITSQGIKCQVNNCYGGSPTIGDHTISPEFEAAIQAAENNQFGPQEHRDPKIPMVVVYNNLQNLDKKHGEGPRSRTIMLLNEKYPLAFRGTTFAKDSDLYLMKKDEHVKWENPAQFGDILLNEFKRSFAHGETGHGFYFHGTYGQWEHIFNQAIASANKHFNAQLEEGLALSPKELQGAYIEYVYSLLNAANEMESIKMLMERGIEDPTIMAISACKENIDRGGMENTKYMYTRLSENYEQRLSLILGVMHSRALSARDRVILRARMPQILNFMKATEPETFRAQLMEFYQAMDYDVSSFDYQPAIEQSNLAPHA